MKIVNRTEFLKLPEGTLFARFGDRVGTPGHYYFSEVRIKDEAKGGNDWWDVGFTDGFTTAHNSMEWIEHLDRAVRGEEIELDFDTLDSDGCYDDGQLYAVFSEDEQERMLTRLQAALTDRRGDTK